MAVWALAAAIGLAACESNQAPSQTPIDGASTTEAVPPDNLRSCRLDVECVKVGISCNACCEQDAVNNSSVAAYESYKTNACAGYMGPVCDCIDRPSTVVCLLGKCALRF